MTVTSILVLAAAAALSSVPALAAEQIVLVERPVGETTVDLGAKGDSVGDLLVFANKVYDAANKTQVGTDNGYCVRTVVGKSWECFWTLTLKAGQITVEGPFMDSGDSLLAVTGGTGKYAGARGSMKLHPRDPTPTGYDFTYDLL
jgi:allene oxide cyclase